MPVTRSTGKRKPTRQTDGEIIPPPARASGCRCGCVWKI